MGGGGKAWAVTGRGGRRREGMGSDRARWEAEERHMQRQGEVGGGRKGMGSDRARWEVQGRHRYCSGSEFWNQIIH